MSSLIVLIFTGLIGYFLLRKFFARHSWLSWLILVIFILVIFAYVV
jgi:hypothetical protein